MPEQKKQFWVISSDEGFKIYGDQHRLFRVGKGVEIQASSKKFAKKFVEIYHLDIVDAILDQEYIGVHND